MRILHFDIDSLRPDRLGCYGLGRNTSPRIDAVAAKGVRFEQVYVSDAPCLPSRSALNSGRFGIHHGAISHGGVAADLFVEGPARSFRTTLAETSWAACLTAAGLHTATISPFAQRHAAWQWYAGFREIHNTGGNGMETADQVAPVAIDWLRRRGKADHWLLHVNLWDPHTPYRTPGSFDAQLTGDPIPAWYTEDVRLAHWDGGGPHSAREVLGFGDQPEVDRAADAFPQQPRVIDSMEAAAAVFEGYDRGTRFADHAIEQVLAELEALGLADDTAVVITADHGESLGELNVYGDHQYADATTCRVPLIVHWPGVTDAQAGRVDRGLHYQFDWAATVLELLGREVPGHWDGRSFAEDFRAGREASRPALVLSQGAWTCQRAARWGDHLLIQSYHDGYHGLPEVMLFNLREDPHEQHNLATEFKPIADHGLGILARWHGEMMRTATHGQDPMWTVMAEGGPAHTRGLLPHYLGRLRRTGRGALADHLASRYPREAAGDGAG